MRYDRFEGVIMGVCIGLLIASLIVLVLDPEQNAKREGFRGGVEYMLKISNTTNIDTKEIGTDAYMSDDEIDSILEASK